MGADLSDAPRHAPPCVRRLARFAPGISVLYGGAPVYLVGGAARGDDDPRDLDLYVPLPDGFFVLCYGEHGEAFGGDDAVFAAIGRWCRDAHAVEPEAPWKRWARDCAKWNARLTADCHRRVDFKTWPASHFADADERVRVRLDADVLARPA